MSAATTATELSKVCTCCDLPICPVGDAWTTGYGQKRDGSIVCNACIMWEILFAMASAEVGARGPDAFYLDGNRVTNWPGTFAFPVTRFGSKSRVPFADHRAWKRRVYFRGPCGTAWSGTEYETMTSGTLLRNVRRLRS